MIFFLISNYILFEVIVFVFKKCEYCDEKLIKYLLFLRIFSLIFRFVLVGGWLVVRVLLGNVFNVIM